MSLIDKNQSWTPPKDHQFIGVTARGSFLLVEFGQWSGDDLRSQICVYVNDMGREVLRVTETFEPIPPEPATHTEPPPLTRWQKFVKWSDVNFGGCS